MSDLATIDDDGIDWKAELEAHCGTPSATERLAIAQLVVLQADLAELDARKAAGTLSAQDRRDRIKMRSQLCRLLGFIGMPPKINHAKSLSDRIAAKNQHREARQAPPPRREALQPVSRAMDPQALRRSPADEAILEQFRRRGGE